MGFSMPALELDIPKLPAHCHRPRTSFNPSLSMPIRRPKRIFSFPASEPAAPKLTVHFLRPRKSFHHNPKCSGCGGDCAAEKHAKTQSAALPPPADPLPCPESSKTAKLEAVKPQSSANAAATHRTNSVPPATGLSNRKRKMENVRVEKGPEFSLPLSKQEIRDDFLVMTGAKPPCRPAKRPKLIQKRLNDLFPGTYLSKRVTESQYNVRHSDLP